MTDKELIKQEIERLHELLPVMDGDNVSMNYAERICTALETYIDSLPEEPASEDLEEASIAYSCANPSERSDGMYDQTDIEWAFEAGAEWQKKKDQETIELAEDHAMLAGMNKMKEEMMKNAVDATILDVDAQTIEFGLWPEKLLDIKEGDKVKIIIVKEEQQ